MRWNRSDCSARCLLSFFSVVLASPLLCLINSSPSILWIGCNLFTFLWFALQFVTVFRHAFPSFRCLFLSMVCFLRPNDSALYVVVCGQTEVMLCLASDRIFLAQVVQGKHAQHTVSGHRDHSTLICKRFLFASFLTSCRTFSESMRFSWMAFSADARSSSILA
jgi:hypothetical protein